MKVSYIKLTALLLWIQLSGDCSHFRRKNSISSEDFEVEPSVMYGPDQSSLDFLRSQTDKYLSVWLWSSIPLLQDQTEY